ncbi:immediate early response gene 5 protein [Diretmus argenteus]
MEYRVEAHRIMSLSLGKIYTSRAQRGGIKLHKNLLVSLVLRSARQVYLHDYYSGQSLTQQPDQDALSPATPESPALSPEDDSSTDPVDQDRRTLLSLNENVVFSLVDSHTDPETPPARSEERPAPAEESCEARPVRRKRGAESSEATDEATKRTKLTSCLSTVGGGEEGGIEEMETGNVTSLISIFGSSFSGLLSSKEAGQSDPEPQDSDSTPGQICCEQMLQSLRPWTTAIVAF